MVLHPLRRSSYYHSVRRVFSLFFISLFSAIPAGTQDISNILEVRFEGTMSEREVEDFASPLFDGYDQPESRYPVEVWEIFVLGPYPGHQPTPVRVQVFVPVMEAIPRAAYLFAPGSTGLINPCRASREHVAGIRWGLYRAHVLSVAAQGFVGILPDYPGFEDPALTQPYFHKETEAANIFAVLEAVDRWLDDRIPGGISNMTRVAAGFSQGGHAAFAAADYNDRFGGYLPIDGAIGYGPSTDISALLQEYPGVAPMIVQSFVRIYGSEAFDPYAILQRQWAERLEYDTTRQCVGGMQAYYPHDAEGLLQKTFFQALRDGNLADAYPSIATIVAENNAGVDSHGVSALILQGTNDIVVSTESQTRFVEMLRAAGNDVRYIIYDGARHDTRQVGFFEALSWIDSLSDNAHRRSVEGARFDPLLD